MDVAVSSESAQAELQDGKDVERVIEGNIEQVRFVDDPISSHRMV